jgi:ABC-2 type transport system ATP-binding protein
MQRPGHGGTVAIESVLVTNKLTKRFKKFVAVDALDLDVWRGEIFGFLGPNGAGKSTTIRMLLGLIRPSSGTAHIFGQDIRKHGTEVRRRIGYMPGELALYENLTPLQLFEYSASLYGVDDTSFAVTLAERLAVTKLESPIGSLSQGNKQKVGIVTALLHRPQLAILDEPTNALDPLIRHELYGILQDAKEEGMTIFLSSHVLAEAERICDRVAIIRDGKLTRVGTVDELKAIAPRRMRISFGEYVPVDEFQDLPGVTNAHVVDGDDRVVELLVRENMDEVVKIASHHPVNDFRSEDISLEDIFLGYYEAGGTTSTIAEIAAGVGNSSNGTGNSSSNGRVAK